MSKRIVRIVVALGLVAGATFVAAPPAHATKCNNTANDVSVGDPQVVFAGVDGDVIKGVCVRAAGAGADVHVPVFPWVSPGGVSPVAGLQVCAVLPGGNTCLWPGAGVTIHTGNLATSAGVVVCGDIPACVTANAGNFETLHFNICLHAAGSIRCVSDPDPTS